MCMGSSTVKCEDCGKAYCYPCSSSVQKELKTTMLYCVHKLHAGPEEVDHAS